MLETHQSLTLFSEAVGTLGAISTLGLGGWVYSLGLQKQRIEEKLADIQKMVIDNKQEAHLVWEKQWGRVDEIKNAQANYVTMERHDISRKETFEAIEKAMQPLMDSVKELRDQIARILERQIK